MALGSMQHGQATSNRRMQRMMESVNSIKAGKHVWGNGLILSQLTTIIFVQNALDIKRALHKIIYLWWLAHDWMGKLDAHTSIARLR